MQTMDLLGRKVSVIDIRLPFKMTLIYRRANRQKHSESTRHPNIYIDSRLDAFSRPPALH